MLTDDLFIEGTNKSVCFLRLNLLLEILEFAYELLDRIERNTWIAKLRCSVFLLAPGKLTLTSLYHQYSHTFIRIWFLSVRGQVFPFLSFLIIEWASTFQPNNVIIRCQPLVSGKPPIIELIALPCLQDQMDLIEIFFRF